MNARLVSLSVLSLVSVCCAPGPPVLLEAVGPVPPRQEAVDQEGTLKVYTATEQFGDSDTYYDEYTGYRIYLGDGTLLEKVSNEVRLPEEPEVVTLPPGRYTVEARAEGFWFVRVPVVIEDGRLTTVHLQRDSRQALPPGEEASWVRLPDGRVVGWRAQQPPHR